MTTWAKARWTSNLASKLQQRRWITENGQKIGVSFYPVSCTPISTFAYKASCDSHEKKKHVHKSHTRIALGCFFLGFSSSASFFAFFFFFFVVAGDSSTVAEMRRKQNFDKRFATKHREMKKVATGSSRGHTDPYPRNVLGRYLEVLSTKPRWWF